MGALRYRVGCWVWLLLLSCADREAAPSSDLAGSDAGSHDGASDADVGTAKDAGPGDLGTDAGAAESGPVGCGPEPQLDRMAPFYGGFVPERDASRGLVAILSERLLVFAERRDPFQAGTELVLVERSDGELQVLDTLSSTVSVPTYFGQGQLWSKSIGGALVALGPSRFALLGSRSGIELYSADRQRLRRLDRIELDASAPLLRAGAASDGKLLSCTSNGIHGYRVAQDRLEALGRVSLRFDCRDLAFSAELGRGAAVSIHKGLMLLDWSDDQLEWTDTIRDVPGYGTVDIGPGGVLALEQANNGAPGAVILYDPDSLERRFALAPSRASYPVGAVWLGEHSIVSWLSYEDEGVSLELRSFGIDQREGPRIRMFGGSNRELRAIGQVTQPVGAHGLVVPRPYRLPVAWSEAGFQPLSGPTLGAASTIASLDESTVWVQGSKRGRSVELRTERFGTPTGLESEVVAIRDDGSEVWLLPPVRFARFGAGQAGERAALFERREDLLAHLAEARLGPRVVDLEAPRGLVELAYVEGDFGRYEVRWRQWRDSELISTSASDVLLDPNSTATRPVQPVFAATMELGWILRPVLARGEWRSRYAWVTNRGEVNAGIVEGLVLDAALSPMAGLVGFESKLERWVTEGGGGRPAQWVELPDGFALDAILDWDGQRGLVTGTDGRLRPMAVTVLFPPEGAPLLESYELGSRAYDAVATELGYFMTSQRGLVRLLPRCLP